jgi:hypothetical protein
VVAQRFDYELSLLTDIFLIERVAAWILTGEHEILPDEYSVFITPVEEVVTLINASAPDADEIAVAPDGKVESLLHGVGRF